MALTPVVDDDGYPAAVTRTIAEFPEPPAAGGTTTLTRIDSTGATDRLAATPPFGYRYADTAGPSDTATVQRTSTRVLADTAAATDTVTVRPVTVILAADTAGASDTTVRDLVAGPPEPADADLPPAVVAVTAGSPQTLTGQVVHIAPADGSVVPAARPQFTCAVTTDADGADLQISYATRPDFTDEVLVATAAAGGLDGIRLSVYPEHDLADDTVYWWRARLADTTGTTAWTDPWSLHVSAGDGTAYAPGTWQVVPGALPGGHLWHCDPGSGADSGQTAIAYGTGLGPDPQVRYGARLCQVTAYTPLPGTAGAYTADRVIAGSVADPYHEAVAFLLPDLDTDDVGDLIVITAGGA